MVIKNSANLKASLEFQQYFYFKHGHPHKLTKALLFLYTTLNPLLSGAATIPTLFLWISPLYRKELRLLRLFDSVLKGFLILLFFKRYALLFRMIIHIRWADIMNTSYGETDVNPVKPDNFYEHIISRRCHKKIFNAPGI